MLNACVLRLQMRLIFWVICFLLRRRTTSRVSRLPIFLQSMYFKSKHGQIFVSMPVVRGIPIRLPPGPHGSSCGWCTCLSSNYKVTGDGTWKLHHMWFIWWNVLWSYCFFHSRHVFLKHCRTWYITWCHCQTISAVVALGGDEGGNRIRPHTLGLFVFTFIQHNRVIGMLLS